MAIKHIHGTVSGSGEIISGKGFRVEKFQQGFYAVVFDQPFSGEPTPVCTIFGPPWKTFNLSIAIVEILPDNFICVTSSQDRPIDTGFSFIVVHEEG